MKGKSSQKDLPLLQCDLKDLRLPTMNAHWKRLAVEAKRKRASYGEYLAELAHLEVTRRRENRIKRRIREAHFPLLKTLDSFEFEEQPSIDRETVLELFELEFVELHSNAIFIGEVGTGKTHLAIALGIACCHKEYRVRYATAAELTNLLVEAKDAGQLSKALNRWARFDVVVLDELGYVPFDKAGADLLFSFITKVYERRSLIVTTNLPFARWSEVFHDATAAAAVIDRVIHHSEILKLEGESYRLKWAKKQPRKKRRSKKT